MAKDWSSLLELVTVGGDETIWERFVEITEQPENSERFELHVLAVTGNDLPADSRTTVAIAVASLLKDIDWNADWAKPRNDLLAALDALLPQMNPQHDAWTTVLRTVRHLLATPCRRDEVRLVASLCNTSLASYLQNWRAAQRPGSPERWSQSALMTFSYLMAQYDAAARGFNHAVGEVLLATMGPLSIEG